METLKRFRLMTVQITLALGVILALGAWAYSPPAAKGLLMGTLASVIVFWMQARALEKLASGGYDKLHSRLSVWSLARLGIYGFVLYRAYTLDRERLHGFLGAVIGLLLLYGVLVVLGVTGLDMKKGEGNSPGGTNR